MRATVFWYFSSTAIYLYTQKRGHIQHAIFLTYLV